MPPPSLTADDFGGDLSASAIIGGTVTGHHLLHIDGYSQTKEELPNGKGIKSCPFRGGGLSWYINYYPNGTGSSSAEFISVYLNLDQSSDKPVKARARFALLDQAGQEVTGYTLTTGLRDFCKNGYGYSEFIKRDFLEGSDYLKDDRFTIKCDVIVSLELRAEERKWSAPQFVVVPPLNLHQHFGDLLVHKEGADVTFQVAGETFKAHRCVLAARSPVFKAQLLGAMKESNKEVVVHVDDMDAQVFKALLGFVYTDVLPDGPDVKKQDEVAMAQHLLVAADRYNLERLKLILP
ncbi:hypothetical protein QOZ80_2BG0180410 [Eleusine coracana subsp. coracana]|nr:hypothetical protein QOZ80_2BG0180410 [Eleusine coracana subsp. coracana]